jgi:hypothetical protein
VLIDQEQWSRNEVERTWTGDSRRSDGLRALAVGAVGIAIMFVVIGAPWAGLVVLAVPALGWVLSVQALRRSSRHGQRDTPSSTRLRSSVSRLAARPSMRRRALRDGAPREPRDAVLGDDGVDVGAGRDDQASRESRHDRGLSSDARSLAPAPGSEAAALTSTRPPIASAGTGPAADRSQ